MLLIGLLYLAFYIIGIGCPIKFLFGISCAGCGMTRAFISLLKLDFIGAFTYHPLWPLVILFIIVYILMKKEIVKYNTYKMILYIMAAIFIVVYIYRLIDVNNNVVTIDFKNSFLYHIFRR